MFTGIIECTGKVISKTTEGSNIMFGFESQISNELKTDQSVSHNGVCLTVTMVKGQTHFVTAIDETITKSNLDELEIGATVNLERAMLSNGRFDGHIVQGHVDGVATCTIKDEQEGSWLFTFKLPGQQGLIVEKGSICVNGVSLTCFDVTKETFSVAIIPFTYTHTTFEYIVEGSIVNIEFDVIGKYVQSIISGQGITS